MPPFQAVFNLNPQNGNLYLRTVPSYVTSEYVRTTRSINAAQWAKVLSIAAELLDNASFNLDAVFGTTRKNGNATHMHTYIQSG
jgi:hypothetical protein